MRTIESNTLIPTAVTTGHSMVFTHLDTQEQFYATRRVANEILAANLNREYILVWVQEVKKPSFEDRPAKPYERMSWLATPSRF